MADDGYVRFSFRPEERRTVEDAEVWVDPPRTARALIRIKTRSRLGGYQLRHRFHGRAVTEPKPAPRLLSWLLRHRAAWPYLPAYVLIMILCRLRARGFASAASHYRWERDESSRQPERPRPVDAGQFDVGS